MDRKRLTLSGDRWFRLWDVWIVFVLALGFLLFATSGPAPAAAQPVLPAISAQAYVLMDAANGLTLAAKNAQQVRPPASLTKIATAMVALQRARLDDVITVSVNAANTGGSRFGLSAGEQEQLWKFLYGLLFRSGNDAAVAIAESTAGSVPRFVNLMNQWARSVGAVSTHFVNPDGLPAVGHYSTARDIALMARAALANPVFARMVSGRAETFTWDGHPRRVTNINQFVWDYPGAMGIKTGYTDSAGFCLAAAAERNGRLLIIVLLGEPSSAQRWADARTLTDYGFKNYPLLASRQLQSGPGGRAGTGSGAGATWTSPDAPVATAAAAPPGRGAAAGTVYVVRPGDTLWDIARKFNVSLDRLTEVNGVASPDRIPVGRKLLIPTAEPPTG